MQPATVTTPEGSTQADQQGATEAAPAPPRRRAGFLAEARFADVIAGVSVALVLIPQSLAYAEIAGMPPVRGLYAAALPPLLAAFVASSPYLQTGPVAITALLTFGALSVQAEPGSPQYVELGLLLALIVGAVRVLIGLSRAGTVAYLMSQPMLMGFTPAAALLIASSQLPAATGADPPGGGVITDAGWTLANPGAWELGAALIALATLALVLGGRRLNPLFPGIVVAVLAGIAVGSLAGYPGEVVGSIPSGFPPISLDLPWAELPALAVSGAVIALVGFSEAASISRVFAERDRRRWDPNREFVSQGVANLAASVSGGFPVGGSFSRSSLNRMAGARSRASGAVTGLVVLAFLPFAALLEPLPTAVLGAIVIAAVAELVRLGPALRLRHVSRPQFAVAMVTFALTLLLEPHVEYAVVAGVGLSLGIHLWRQLSLDVESSVDDGVLRLWLRGDLWFGNARQLEDELGRRLAAHPEARRIAVHLGGLGRLDTTGALALRSFVAQAREGDAEVELYEVPPALRRLTEGIVECRSEPF